MADITWQELKKRLGFGGPLDLLPEGPERSLEEALLGSKIQPPLPKQSFTDMLLGTKYGDLANRPPVEGMMASNLGANPAEASAFQQGMDLVMEMIEAKGAQGSRNPVIRPVGAPGRKLQFPSGGREKSVNLRQPRRQERASRVRESMSRIKEAGGEPPKWMEEFLSRMEKKLRDPNKVEGPKIPLRRLPEEIAEAKKALVESLQTVPKTALELAAEEAAASIPDQPTRRRQDRTEINASGDSEASLEAMNRLRSFQSQGKQHGVRGRDGKIRRLIGPEAVDYKVRPGEEYGIIHSDGYFEVLDKG